jgi:hypothetical protein
MQSAVRHFAMKRAASRDIIMPESRGKTFVRNEPCAQRSLDQSVCLPCIFFHLLA